MGSQIDRPREVLADCGSTACAIGWMPVIWPKSWFWGDLRDDEDSEEIQKASLLPLHGIPGHCLLDRLGSWYAISPDMVYHVFYLLNSSPIWRHPYTPPSLLVAVLRLIVLKTPQTPTELWYAWGEWDTDEARLLKATALADLKESRATT